MRLLSFRGIRWGECFGFVHLNYLLRKSHPPGLHIRHWQAQVWLGPMSVGLGGGGEPTLSRRSLRIDSKRLPLERIETNLWKSSQEMIYFCRNHILSKIVISFVIGSFLRKKLERLIFFNYFNNFLWFHNYIVDLRIG